MTDDTYRIANIINAVSKQLGVTIELATDMVTSAHAIQVDIDKYLNDKTEENWIAAWESIYQSFVSADNEVEQARILLKLPPLAKEKGDMDLNGVVLRSVHALRPLIHKLGLI